MKFTVVQVLLLLLAVVKICNCNVVINEINSMGPGTGSGREKHTGRHKGSFFVEKFEFVELWSVTPNFSLKGYKLLGISAETRASKPPTIELVVDLWAEKTDDNGFFVVGGRAVEKAQLKVPNENIMYREMFSNEPRQLLLSNFLLNGWSKPKAIVLLYKENERFRDLTLKKTSTFININDEVLNTITENLADMVVYAEKAGVERCNIFEQIQPRFANTNYMLREFDRGNKDNSLNRCSVEMTGCIPEQFKLIQAR